MQPAKNRNIRVLVHDYSGHSFTIQLSRQLADNGYMIRHVYSAAFQAPKGPLCPRADDPDNLCIVGLSLTKPFQKYSFWRRRIQEIEYGRLVQAEIAQFAPDVVISANSPLDTQKLILKKCRQCHSKFVFWVQDLYGIAIQQILQRKFFWPGSVIGRYYMAMEKKLLQASDEIIAITRDFVPLIHTCTWRQRRIHTIENWAPLPEIPVMPKDNFWSRRHGLNAKFCFVYSGTLGLKHDPEILWQLASHFRHYPQVRVVVVSEGLGADWLRKRQRRQRLDNLVLFDFQAYEDFPAVLACGDVLLAVLEGEAGLFSVPSKILSYLCAARPLLLAVPPENLAAQIVTASHAGIVVAPTALSKLTAAAEELLADSSRRYRLGQNGRKYAREHFDIAKIAARFQEIIAPRS